MTTTVVEGRPSTPPRSDPITTARSQAGFAVRSVTDGDTLALTDGRRVRLAQVDAPETNESFASESTRALRTVVEGTTVTLRRPSNGPEKDPYGRTLAEVSVAGRSVNEQLVRDGAAEWYDEFGPEDPDLAVRLRAGERDARSTGRGLWSLCGARAVAGSPSPTHTVAPSSRCHLAYPDGCIPPPAPDLDCADIERRVRVNHAHGDPHRLDANKDGWGCEIHG